MKLRLTTRLYDDSGKECKEGDEIMIQAKDMDLPGQAIIQEIKTSYFTIMFNDRIIGYQQRTLRPQDVMVCTKQ